MREKKVAALIFLAVLVLAIVLRFYRLGFQSLWIDEVATFLNSSGSLRQVIFNPPINPMTPPLYYVLTHGLLRFGNQESLLRFPALFFGLIGIAIFFLVLRNWFGTTVGLIGASLMTISPFHVWYSQEARPYTMLLFLSLLSVFLFQNLLKKQKSGWLRLAFILTTASTFYCHTGALAFIGLLVVYTICTVPRSKWTYWILTYGGVALLVAPAAFWVWFNYLGTSNGNRQAFHPFSIPYVVWVFGTGFSLGPTVNELHMPDRLRYVIPYLHIILPVTLFFSALLLYGVLALWKLSRPNFWFILLWFAGPVIFVALCAIFLSYHFNVRYAIFSLPPFLILISTGAQNVKQKWLRGIVFICLCFISAFSLSNYFFNTRYHRDNVRVAGRFLTTHALTNDNVVCSVAYAMPNLEYYCDRDDINLIGYPVDTRFVDPSHVESDLNRIVAGQERFWLFLNRTYHSDPEGYIRKYCDENYRRIREMTSDGVDLTLYQK